MQRQAVAKAVLDARAPVGALAPAARRVDRVAEDRVQRVREVDAELVGAPRLGVQLQDRRVREPPQHLPAGERGPGIAGAHGDLLAVFRVAADGGVPGPLVLLQDPPGDGEVGLFDLPPGELLGERAVGAVVLGHEDHPGGALVEAVDDAGPHHAADAGEVGDRGQQRVHERPPRVPGSRVHDHARGLVHGDEIRVLVQDLDRDILGQGRRRDRRGQRDFDQVAVPNGEVIGGHRTVDRDHPGADQGLPPAARDIGNKPRDELVEPHSGGLGVHLKMVGRTLSHQDPEQTLWLKRGAHRPVARSQVLVNSVFFLTETVNEDRRRAFHGSERVPVDNGGPAD